MDRTFAAAVIALGLTSLGLVSTHGAAQPRSLVLLLHALLGLVLLPLLAVWWWRRRRALWALAAATLLAGSILAGSILAVAGSTLDAYLIDRSAVVGLHVVLGAGGFAALVLALRGGGRRWRWAAAGLALGVVVAAAVAIADSAGEGDAEALFVNPPAAASLAAEALGGEDGPFYPSAARTAAGRPVAVGGSMSCAGCHPRETAEWESSAHRWSGVADPWYRRTLKAYREERGAVAARWCAGCHDPALLLSGEADASPAEMAASPAGSEGVGCTLCHGISAVGSTIGQGHYTLGPLPGRSGTEGLEALLIRLDPESHRRLWSRPVLTGAAASELCSTCHKAHLEGVLNGYRHLESLNDYDAWQAASISGRGARSFYWPEQAQSCADCHLPRRPDGGRSHRFATADTTAALLAGDREQLAAVADFLGGGHVTVDLFALSETPEDGRAPELRAAPLNRGPPAAVRPGESVRVDAVVRVRGVGHLFPGGKNGDVDCWLELVAVDPAGRRLFASGSVEPGHEGGGPVATSAHFFRRRRSDGDGQPVERRDTWRARAELYNQSIQPNTADVVRYRLEVPSDTRGEIRLVARLLYRQHSWAFDRWVRESVEESLPELPILTVAEDAVTLRIASGGEAAPAADGPAAPSGSGDRDRWNDYGIGLLLQGDLRGARTAFSRVTEIDPEWADGWLNLARVATNEGDVEAIEAALTRAEELAPGLARVRYYRGRLEQSLGNLPAAQEHLRAVADAYPADRLVRAQLGQLLLLTGDAAAAAEEFQAVLDVDSESAAAHLNLSQAYRATGDVGRADRHLRLYERFRRDEEARALARAYLESHPDDNRERQAIHEHHSEPLAPPSRPEAR